MNVFKRQTTWSGGELWLFKFSVFVAGIIVGCYLQKFLSPFLHWFLVIGGIGCIISGYKYLTKLKKR